MKSSRKAVLWLWVLAFFGWAVMDTISTYVAIEHFGAVETVPFSKYLLDTGGYILLFSVKASIILLFFWSIELIPIPHQYKNVNHIPAALIFTCLGWGVSVHNLTLLA